MSRAPRHGRDHLSSINMTYSRARGHGDLPPQVVFNKPSQSPGQCAYLRASRHASMAAGFPSRWFHPGRPSTIVGGWASGGQAPRPGRSERRVEPVPMSPARRESVSHGRTDDTAALGPGGGRGADLARRGGAGGRACESGRDGLAGISPLVLGADALLPAGRAQPGRALAIHGRGRSRSWPLRSGPRARAWPSGSSSTSPDILPWSDGPASGSGARGGWSPRPSRSPSWRWTGSQTLGFLADKADRGKAELTLLTRSRGRMRAGAGAGDPGRLDAAA